MCAYTLLRSGMKNIAIIESNRALGEKIRVSGGGKCNVTNKIVDASFYLGDASFVRSVLEQFPKEALIKMLQEHAIELELRKGRYLFCKKSAKEVIAMLSAPLEEKQIFYGEKVVDVTYDEHFLVKSDKGVYRSKRVVVATGGESFKSLGASDIGIKIAKSFGDATRAFEPALVGLTLQKEQLWMKSLSGISLPVEIEVANRHIKEELLFAHRGITGPAVLSASLYWRKGHISINFMPNETIESIIKRGGKKKLSNAIPLPKRFVQAFLKEIELEDKECHKLTYIEKKRLQKIHGYTFAPAGNFGFSKAEVSRGGVLSCDIEVESMQSRHQKDLFYIGEVVDVTGELGGYNIQWALSSAVVCANFIIKC